MRNLLALAAFLALTIAGVGWYLGWYQIHTSPAANGHRKIEVDVNGTKITEDLKKGKEKLKDILNGDEGTTQTVTPGTSRLPPVYTGSEPSEEGGFYPGNYSPPPFPTPPPVIVPPVP